MSATITIGKWTIEGSNHQELIGLKKEIFREGRYEIDLDVENPRIIDGGAHVGLAALYFKSRWPQAKITCVEPLPENAKYLKHNLWLNRFDDIEVIEAALADKAGEMNMYFDNTGDEWFSTAGFCEGAWNHEQQSDCMQVKTISLSSLITEPVDILKLDTEGAETFILTAAAKSLPLIHHIVMEYHPHPANNWHELMTFLKKNHFTSTEKIPPNYPTWLRNYHFINNHFLQ